MKVSPDEVRAKKAYTATAMPQLTPSLAVLNAAPPSASRMKATNAKLARPTSSPYFHISPATDLSRPSASERRTNGRVPSARQRPTRYRAAWEKFLGAAIVVIGDLPFLDFPDRPVARHGAAAAGQVIHLRLVAELIEQPHAALVGDQLRNLALGVVEIAEVARSGRTGHDASRGVFALAGIGRIEIRLAGARL